MLAVSIVHKHHRELESLCLIELDEAENTCSCLLAASYHLRNKVCIFGVHEIDKITAIVDDDVRAHFKHSSDVCLIFLGSRIVPCEHIKTCLDKGSSHIILG